MPSFVIVSAGRIGEVIDAVICDPHIATGVPDRTSDTPVRIKIVSEKTLIVDGAPHQIISTVGINGRTTFLINGSSKGLRNRERRIGLAKASSLLQQLAASLKPIQAESGEPGLATEGLALLFGWIAAEREAATAAARPETTPSRELVSK